MKKSFLLLIILLFSVISVQADNYNKIEYKNIKNNQKIAIIQNNWTKDNIRNDREHFKKRKSSNIMAFSEYCLKNGDLAFSTGADYEFIHKGRFVGYSNLDLKFYEYEYKDSQLLRRELSECEIQELFPDFEIIKISEFSDKTNILKIKKCKKDLKIVLLNDTDASFYNYWFHTNNSHFEPYELKGFLKITKTGMIHFSRNDDNYKKNAWFVLLIR